jgi:hypothetical protein
MIVFLSCLVGFLRRRELKVPLRLLSRSKVVFRCTNRWGLRKQALPRSAGAVAGGLIGVVLLALDFVGG